MESALQSEVEVLRGQLADRAAAEAALEGEVRELQQQVRSKREQLDGVIVAAREKEAENAALWEQVKAVSELAAAQGGWVKEEASICCCPRRMWGRAVRGFLIVCDQQ